MRSGPGEARTILLLHIISVRPSKQPLMVRTFLKVYMELGSYFLFLQEQIKDIIIIGVCVFITAVPIIKLFAWGEGDTGGHVLRETTSCVYYCSTYYKAVRCTQGPAHCLSPPCVLQIVVHGLNKQLLLSCWHQQIVINIWRLL